MVHHKERSEAVLLRFVAKIHANMLRVPYNYWKMFFCDVSRGGHNRRRDMATRSLLE